MNPPDHMIGRDDDEPDSECRPDLRTRARMLEDPADDDPNARDDRDMDP